MRSETRLGNNVYVIEDYDKGTVRVTHLHEGRNEVKQIYLPRKLIADFAFKNMSFHELLLGRKP